MLYLLIVHRGEGMATNTGNTPPTNSQRQMMVAIGVLILVIIAVAIIFVLPPRLPPATATPAATITLTP